MAKIGRPAWIPTPAVLKEIEKYASKMLVDADIAYNINVHPSTFSEKKSLYPEIDEAIKKGRASARGFLANAAFETATKGSIPMQIFLSKVHLNWKENDPLEQIQINNNQLQITQNLAQLSDTELLELTKSAIGVLENQKETQYGRISTSRRENIQEEGTGKETNRPG